MKEKLIKLLLGPIVLPIHWPKDRMRAIAEAYATNILADDFIQIVRCKNCRHYTASRSSNGYGWCEYYNTGATDKHYCSHGERKDDNK